MVDLLSPVSPDAFQTMPVREEMAFDDGPGKWRIGLIVLSNDYTVERDFMNMRPNDDVAIFTTRIANSADCTVKCKTTEIMMYPDYSGLFRTIPDEIPETA